MIIFENILEWATIFGYILLVWHCPIFKPYFGFWKRK